MEQLLLGGIEDFTAKMDENEVVVKDLQELVKKITPFTIIKDKKTEDIQDVVYFNENYIYATNGHVAIRCENNTSIRNILDIDTLKKVTKENKKNDVVKLDYDLNIDNKHKDKFIEIFQKENNENFKKIKITKEYLENKLKEIEEDIKFLKANKQGNTLKAKSKELLIKFDDGDILINRDYLKGIVGFMKEEDIAVKYIDRHSVLVFEDTEETALLMPIKFHDFQKENFYNIQFN